MFETAVSVQPSPCTVNTGANASEKPAFTLSVKPAKATSPLAGRKATRRRLRPISAHPPSWSASAAGDAAPAVHGRSRSPGLLRTSSGTGVKANVAAPAMANVAEAPTCPSSHDATAAVPATLSVFLPHIRLLARACSSSGTTSMVSASVATSWRARKRLPAVRSAVSRPRFESGSGASAIAA